MEVFTGSDIDAYRLLVLKAACGACKRGMRINRAYTPSRVKGAIETALGRTFKRGAWDEMAAAIDLRVQEMKAKRDAKVNSNPS